MRYISIQKKPTLWGELLMVFIISLYKLYISIPYGAIKRIVIYASHYSHHFNSLWCDYFYKDTKYILIKQMVFKCFFIMLIDKNKVYVCKYC